jgi:hypothetical protein
MFDENSDIDDLICRCGSDIFRPTRRVMPSSP